MSRILHKLSLIKAIWKGGETTMVDVYVALIVYKRRTIDEVPAHLKPAVLAELAALGLDGNGDLIKNG